jgi:hypothetical protein
VRRTVRRSVTSLTIQAHFHSPRYRPRATNKLLDANRDRFGREYSSAVQLFARITNDLIFMESLKTIYQQSGLIASSITTAMSQIISLNTVIGQRFPNFSWIVRFDLNEVLKRYILQLMSSYQNKYQATRLGAASYISDSASQLNLIFRLNSSLRTFNSRFEAQRFYSGVLVLLDECSLSSDLANIYLDEAINMETVKEK